MPNGDQTPFISLESVRSALDGMVYASVEKPPSPLQFLCLVDRLLADPDVPPAENNREFALRQILVSIITDEFFALRRVQSVQPVTVAASLDVVLEEIEQISHHDSPELIGWGWLYYRYVRVDLNLSSLLFSQAVHVDERSLRRYQQHALKQLTHRLTQQEWKARVEQRQRRLLAAIPISPMHPLVGREKILLQVASTLEEAKTVYITGPAGIGKTALVAAVLRNQIEAGWSDQFVWISRPPSTDFVYQYLRDYLLPNGGGIDLSEYLLLYHTIVILDDSEALLEAPEALQRLLDQIHSARVLMTGRTMVPLPNAVHIVLPELTCHEVETVVTHFREQSGQEDLIDETHSRMIWEQVGGNPLAIQLVLSNWYLLDVRALVDYSVDHLFSRAYQNLSSNLKSAWFAFALFPPGDLDPTHVLRCWPVHVRREWIAVLLGQHLLEAVAPLQASISLSMSARHFIEHQYQTDATAQLIMGELIADLDQALETDPARALDVVEYLLHSNALLLDPLRRRQWIQAGWREGVRRGHWAKWSNLLGDYLNHEGILAPDIRLAYGMCLRRCGDWALAQQIFEAAIAEFGHKGLFLEQARALFEETLLLRYQGQYERAVAVAARAERIAARYQDEDLLLALRMEQVQVAVDRRDPRTAQKILSSLPKTTRVLALWSETYLLLGNWKRCQLFAQKAFEQAQEQETIAQLHTLMGRSCEEMGELDHARQHFEFALTLLEESDDRSAVSRAQSNLGALFIRLNQYEEARFLLNRAESIQSRLKDRVALAVTRHNLHILETQLPG